MTKPALPAPEDDNPFWGDTDPAPPACPPCPHCKSFDHVSVDYGPVIDAGEPGDKHACQEYRDQLDKGLVPFCCNNCERLFWGRWPLTIEGETE